MNSEFQAPITGTIVANGGTLDVKTSNSGTTVVQFQGTWTGTIVLEGSQDGTNYTALPIVRAVDGALLSSLAANGLYFVPSAGLLNLRARATAWTSGTANINSAGSDAVVLPTVKSMLHGTDGTPLGVLVNPLMAAMPKTVSTLNSSTTPLGSSATFTGTFEDTLQYPTVSVVVFANQAGSLIIEWSTDGTNVDANDTFSILASTGKQFSFGAMARYFRVRYVNGAVAQGAFRLQSVLHRTNIKPSSHRVAASIVDDDDAELGKVVLTGRALDGQYYNVQVDNQGRLVTSAITGFGAAFAFGDITTAATTRTAVRRTAYTEQTSNAQRSIVSSSANDAAAGTGARTVRLTYMDSTGAGPFTEDITLNGVTAVNTVATNICFIEKITVLTVGSTGSNVGTLTLRAAAAGGGAVIGTIAPTDNQTFWAHHYIPTGKECNITGLSVSHNGTTVGSGGTFTINAIPIPQTNQVDRQISDTHRLYGQSSTTPRTYISPLKVSGPARLTVYVTPETGSSTVYRSSVDFFEP